MNKSQIAHFIAKSLLVGALVTLVSSAAVAQTVPQVTITVQTGDAALGSTIDTIYPPATDGEGKLAFLGVTADGQGFIWHNGAVINSSTPAVINSNTTAELFGVANDGRYAFAPEVNGNEALQTEVGVILEIDNDAPLFADTVDRIRVPWRSPTGALFVLVELDSGDWVLYTTPDGDLANAAIVLSTGGSVGGTDTADRLFDRYAVSDDGNHYIIEGETVENGSADTIIVDGAVALVSGQPAAGSGDRDWTSSWDVLSINNDGNYIVTGNLSGDAADAEFLSYNGTVAIRRGAMIGGHTLGSNVRGASINNRGHLAFSWTTDTGEALFLACDPTDIASDVTVLLATDQMVDTDGDGVADATVSDFNYSNSNGRLLDLADNGRVYIQVDIAGNEAIVEVPYTCCVGDRTTGDTDNDGICNNDDVCEGDDSTGDSDGDGICDDIDICRGDNATGDSDSDGICDNLDMCTGDDGAGDTDGDGACDDTDPCPTDNPDDTDGDGVCNGVDVCEGDDATGDTDGDGMCDDADLCLGNNASGDTDGDGICNDRDICTGDDSTGDGDNDDICDNMDECLGNDASGDTDGDDICDDRDVCTGDDTTDDSDGDGVCDNADVCAGDDATGDTDGDGLCADRDACEGDNASGDADSDGVCDNLDACMGHDSTGDTDGDGVCDGTDRCPNDNPDDSDGDGVCDSRDVCAGEDDATCGDDDDDGCSASGVGSSGMWLVVVVLAGMMRRRWLTQIFA